MVQDDAQSKAQSANCRDLLAGNREGVNIMESEHLAQLAVLRVAVGCLGEQANPRWWPSSFFGTGSKAFLSPIFPRTQMLAQYHGVREAGSVVHDERIGVGIHVFHLFRLPEDLEQSLHQVVHQPDVAARMAEHTASGEAALGYLQEFSAGKGSEGVGPVCVGALPDLRKIEPWHQVAGCYAAGFAARSEVYPYFAGE